MSASQAAASEVRRASAEGFRNDAGSTSSSTTGRSTRLPSISALLNSSTADLAPFDGASSSSGRPLPNPPPYQTSQNGSVISTARISFDQQYMQPYHPNGAAHPLFAFGAASQSPPSHHWVVSPSSPSSRRSSMSLAFPNGNALHPLPSGLAGNDGRPRSASTPFVSYHYGGPSQGRQAGFALSSERGSTDADSQAGPAPRRDGRWSPPPAEDFSRPRSVSIPSTIDASHRGNRTGAASFTKLPSMSEYDLPQPIAVRHGTHPSFAGHASAVPRFAFLGPSDSPSAISNATTDEDEQLAPPLGYPFKDSSYRPVAAGQPNHSRRPMPILKTDFSAAGTTTTAAPLPLPLPAGLAQNGSGSPATSESSAPSPLSASSSVATSPKTQQARSSLKRSRQSLATAEEADLLPPLPADAVVTATEGASSENGRYTCPHCPKRFARPSSLRIHMHSHTGEKPFTCNLCDRAFSVQSNLRRHLKIHKGGPNGGDAAVLPKLPHPPAPHLDIPAAADGPLSAAPSLDSAGPSSAVSSETTTSLSSLDSLPTPVDIVRPGPVLKGLGPKLLNFDEREEDAIMESPDDLLSRSLA